MRRDINIKCLLIIYICLLNVISLKGNGHMNRWLCLETFINSLMICPEEESSSQASFVKSEKGASSLYAVIKNHNNIVLTDSRRQSEILPELDSFINNHDISNSIKSVSQLYKAIVLDEIYNQNPYILNKRTKLSDYKNKAIDEWSANNFVDSIFNAVRQAVVLVNKNKETELNSLDSLNVLFDIDNKYETTVKDLIYTESNRLLKKYAANKKRNRPVSRSDEAIEMNKFISAIQTPDNRIDSLVFDNLRKQMRFYMQKGNTDKLLYNEFQRIDYLLFKGVDVTPLYNDIINNYSDFYSNQTTFNSQSALVVKATVFYYNNPYVLFEKENKKELNEELTSLLKKLNIVITNTKKDNPFLSQLEAIRDNILSKYTMLEYDLINHSDLALNMRLKYKNTDKAEVNLYRDDIRLYRHNYDLKNEYVENELEIKLPKQKYGKYSIEVISEGCDTLKSDIIISDLMSLIQTNGAGINKVVVVDRNTGYPVKGARVEVFESDKNALKTIPIAVNITDKNGILLLSDIKKVNVEYKVTYGNDKYQDNIKYYNYLREKQKQRKERRKNAIFTDRDIFRPCQNVSFKIISFTEKENSRHIDSENAITVELYDPNNRLIEKKELITDSYGAVYGAFRLPDSGLSGRYRLEVSSLDAGKQVKTIVVEDYKRNSVSLDLEPIDTDYAYGDTMSISGSLTTDYGAYMSNAKVRVKLQRNQFYKGEDIIYSAETETDRNGDFSFDLTIDNPEEVIRYYYPRYILTVEATAPNGEIIDISKQINIAENSLTIKPEVDMSETVIYSQNYGCQYIDKDKSPLFTLDIYNSDNQKQNVNCELSIFKGDINSKGDTIYTFIRSINAESGKSFSVKTPEMKSGLYEFRFTAKDSKGRINSYNQKYILYSLKDRKMPFADDFIFISETKNVHEDGSIDFYIGTSLNNVSVLIDVFSKNDNLLTERVKLSDQLKHIRLKTRNYNSGVILVNVSFIKDEKLYNYSNKYGAFKTEKYLVINPSFFRNKLLPGEEEICEFEVKDNEGNNMNSQLLASMYDASLDKIYPSYPWIINTDNKSTALYLYWNYNSNNKRYISGQKYVYGNQPVPYAVASETAVGKLQRNGDKISLSVNEDVAVAESDGDGIEENKTRKNFSETAFFYPLLNSKNGKFKFSYKVPDALTKWNLRLFAHTVDMRYGNFNGEVITTKDLTAALNIPSFVRNGDDIDISILLNNLDSIAQNCMLYINISDAFGKKVIYSDSVSLLLNARESVAESFRFSVPAGYDLLTVETLLKGNAMTDGEIKYLSVLPSETIVTKSKVISMNKAGTKSLYFDEFAHNINKVNRNVSYKIEYTSNPVWIALLSLPSQISQPVNSLSDAVYTYYLTMVLKNIVAKNPVLTEFIEKYKISERDGDSSPLELDEEMKLFILRETPWLNDALSESAAINSLGSLLDINIINYQMSESIAKLQQLQNADGGFAWYYDNGTSSLYLTLWFLRQMEDLRAIADTDFSESSVKKMIYDAVVFTDREMIKRHEGSRKDDKKRVPGYEDILWTYIRSLSSDIPFTDNSISIHKQNVEYMLKNRKKLSLAEKSLAAITLNRLGYEAEANDIIEDIKSLSVTNDDMGMYWPNNRSTTGSSALSTHVLLMNALVQSGVSSDEINQMKLWLLKNKQTNMWRSKTVYIDAIMGLLLRGSDWTTSDKPAIVQVGSFELPSYGFMGYSDTTFYNNAITADLANINITQNFDHPAYGAVYWQAFEDFNSVRDAGKELKIRKELYRKVLNNQNIPTLMPIDSIINVGDIITARFVISSDRDLEFVALKDNRAACFEPYEMLSGYRYRDGVGYYIENKDSRTDMFFDRIPKGTYVIEYDLKTTQSGQFVDGISTVQSMYSPEFIGNSSAGRVKVIK